MVRVYLVFSVGVVELVWVVRWGEGTGIRWGFDLYEGIFDVVIGGFEIIRLLFGV